jgi:hypothetical protein
MSVYSQEIELSVDEAIIPWRVHLKFRTYNPGKIVKYGMLVRMVLKLYQDIFVTWCSGEETGEHFASSFRQTFRSKLSRLSRQFL